MSTDIYQRFFVSHDPPNALYCTDILADPGSIRPMATALGTGLSANNAPCRLLELPPELRLAIYDFLPEGDKTTSFRHGMWHVDINAAAKCEEFPADALSLFNTCTKTRIELTPLHDRWIHALAPVFVLGPFAQVQPHPNPAVFFHLANHTTNLRIRVDLWQSDCFVAEQAHKFLRDLGHGHKVEFLDFRMEGWSEPHGRDARSAIEASFDCVESMECKFRHERPWRGIWDSVQYGFYLR
ncbi:hypothetical protein B0A48_04719 [Cryoendolithus antarcticus]|uniref:F-box domain-containing protein n=1 Tax=Cryoendolithus antarcticus TaxID=1507870 RepID=A0A1V8TDI9_9PEZI|nr:hypothetical protein B0A48_04719 [Cryoendolithus antarcticus]